MAHRERTRKPLSSRKAAKARQELFGTPYVVGVPMGAEYSTLIREAHEEEKDMRTLIQIKGMGCGGCCG